MSDAQATSTPNELNSRHISEPFPSSTITNESFMRIDDWPKQATLESKSSTTSFLAKQRQWVRSHRFFSTIATSIALVLLLVIALAIVLPLTLSNSGKSAAILSNTSGIPSNDTLSTQQPSTIKTTTEPFQPGYWIEVNTQMFDVNDTNDLHAMRADPRRPGDYILTASHRIILLSSCNQQMKSLIEWNRKNDVISCSNNTVSTIAHRLTTMRSCERCDVFDVNAECRHNFTECTSSSFAYCCQNCSSASSSSSSVCSLRGSSLVDYESIFLDALFKYHNNTSYSLLFSTQSNDHVQFCVLQQQLMRYEGAKVALLSLPSQSCDTNGNGNLQSAAVITLSTLQNTWKALLYDTDTLYLSHSNGTLHVINNLVNMQAKLLLQPSGDAALLVDFSKLSGRFSAIQIGQNKFDILIPRQVSISIPGTFMDAFLDNGELVLWNVLESAVFVTRIRFSWT